MSLRIGLFYPNSSSMHALSTEVVRQSPDLLDMQSHIECAQVSEAVGTDYLFMAEVWSPYDAAERRLLKRTTVMEALPGV
ncbi:MAG: hypothetical protein OXT06_29420 [Rhodospirillaceae bacterium]|nr:hypothetical protein [Rhodospirillaceae bacterium]MDD9918320.1 hypothetical protein [Rhodospirillaceae bacterium]MDD9928682.1 hypothetical protein [Rhodospirillaceae bacterium]